MPVGDRRVGGVRVGDLRLAMSANEDGAVIARTFAVLEAFRTQPVIGVSAIARITGLPRSTVHRLAQQLVEVGALTRVGREYRLGVKLFELGSAHYPTRLRDALQPFLVDLQRATGADVATAEAIGNDVVIVESVRARTSGPSAVELGARLPAHATSAGKVIMAYGGSLPDQPAGPLVALTARTVTEMPVLAAQLAAIRRDGLAVERGELKVGRSSVAAPLLNRHGRVLGALMVSGPDTEFHPEAVGVAVTAVARTLTRIGAGTNIEFYARLQPHRDGAARSGPARPDGARRGAPLSPGVR